MMLETEEKTNLFVSGLKYNPFLSTFNPRSSSFLDQGQQYLALLLSMHHFIAISKTIAFARLIHSQCFFSWVSDYSHNQSLTQFSKLISLSCGTACWVASQFICFYSLVPQTLEPPWLHLVGTSGHLTRKSMLPPFLTEAMGVCRPWSHSQVMPELTSDPLSVLSLSRQVLDFLKPKTKLKEN